MMKVLDLFSGIGGFSLGLERTGGFETVAFCEIEDYPRKVLAKHWPDVPIFGDVKELTNEQVGSIDVICGGFPCQDISVAGKQAGIKEGTRSGLWSEVSRLVSEIRPKYVIVENVTNLLAGPSEQRGRWFGRVLGDLASIGYDAEWHSVSASSIGASHKRDRVWIIAYPNDIRLEGVAKKPILRQSFMPLKPMRGITQWPSRHDLPAPTLCRKNDGVPSVAHRLKCLGNAVIPQIPEMIGNAILEAEHEFTT